MPSPSLGTPTEAPTESRRPTPAPPRSFDADNAVRTVQHLAGAIGPREATSVAYRRAADWLATTLTGFGYQVRRQPVRVPAGVSWGVPVPAGLTWNVIATRPGFDPRRPHLIVGAHLDTVPQAPGAEDNASGIAVLVELARVVRSRLPIVFVGFGAEEPRGPGDARHHYGSRAYVAAMPAGQRNALRGMVSLDRVGVGNIVPVCIASAPSEPLRAELLAAAAARIPVRRCTNRSSDHWSFARVGMRGVRLGSTPYAEYHSRDDRPSVVRRDQLDRTGRLVLNWLTG